ncbi:MULTISPECIES: hypothetical protein [Yersinia]|uniref:hypothetical protein n=1 Tax=Yersinia TaxID=629 RepID=UPI000B71F91E|nr:MULTISPECIES: hypothetical protein [Yersinia]EKN5999729.1 hypothetical protein [Yersinia enterocolitica]ELI7924880.1 hypothetical protein [Yersinia enterocolitica]MBW5826222.1 hypothetical protein [Yersinia kristensenii]MBW5836415.1 hypothetical protein [Yersinia enterocolitica]MBW5845519.1 hypothetical protein [Yersinia enterocolitica]
MSENAAFMEAINVFCDKANHNINEVVKIGGMKILTRLVRMSPVGNPELWQVNQNAVNYNRLVSEANEAKKLDPKNLTRTGRLKKNAKVQAKTWSIYSPRGYTGGRFKGNWQVTFDEMPTGETGRIDKSGNMTLAMGNVALEHFKVGVNAVYFSNIVPYARELEFGHSSQAPNGMVRIVARDAAKLFNEAALEVGKK